MEIDYIHQFVGSIAYIPAGSTDGLAEARQAIAAHRGWDADTMESYFIRRIRYTHIEPVEVWEFVTAETAAASRAKQEREDFTRQLVQGMRDAR